MKMNLILRAVLIAKIAKFKIALIGNTRDIHKDLCFKTWKSWRIKESFPRLSLERCRCGLESCSCSSDTIKRYRDRNNRWIFEEGYEMRLDVSSRIEYDKDFETQLIELDNFVCNLETKEIDSKAMDILKVIEERNDRYTFDCIKRVAQAIANIDNKEMIDKSCILEAHIYKPIMDR